MLFEILVQFTNMLFTNFNRMGVGVPTNTIETIGQNNFLRNSNFDQVNQLVRSFESKQ